MAEIKKRHKETGRIGVFDENKQFVRWDDEQPLEDPQEIGKLETLIRSLGQGATYGFADEALAKIQSLGNKTYEQAIEEQRAKFKASEEANPTTAMIGELLGGLAVPIPGTGVKAAAKIASLPLKAAIKESAKTGAKIGSAYAAGKSETDLTEDPLTLVKEIGIGSGTGALLGAGLPAASKLATSTKIGAGAGAVVGGLTAGPIGAVAGAGLGAPVGKLGGMLTDYAATSPVIQRAIDVYKGSLAGKKFAGELENINKKILDFSNKAANAIYTKKDRQGAKLGKELTKLEETGIEFNIKNDLNDALNLAKQLPEANDLERNAKKILIETLENKLKGRVVSERIPIEKAVPGSAGALAEKEALERATAEVEGKVLADNIQSEILPTEIPGLSAGVVTKPLLEEGVESGRKIISKMPIREGLPDTEIQEKVVRKITDPETLYKPTGLKSFISSLKELTYLGDSPLKTDQGKKVVLDLIHKLDNKLTKASPAYGREKEIFSDYVALAENIVGKDLSDELKKSEIPGIIEGISAIIRRYGTDVEKKVAIDKIFNEGFINPKTGNKVEALNKTSPKMAQYLQKNIAELAKDFDLTSAINNSLQNTSSVARTLASLEGFVLRGAELAGKASKHVRVGKARLVDSSTESLSQLADQVASKGGTTAKTYSNTLREIASKPENKRKALLFGLMQRPDFRQMLEDIEGIQQEE